MQIQAKNIINSNKKWRRYNIHINDNEDFKTGYGKPPKHTQWVKGQSGNPSGGPPKVPDPISFFKALEGSLDEYVLVKNQNGEEKYVQKSIDGRY